MSICYHWWALLCLTILGIAQHALVHLYRALTIFQGQAGIHDCYKCTAAALCENTSGRRKKELACTFKPNNLAERDGICK